LYGAAEAVELRYLVEAEGGQWVACAYWVPVRQRQVGSSREVDEWGRVLKVRLSPDRVLAYPFISRRDALSVASEVRGQVVPVPRVRTTQGASLAV